MNTVMTSDMMRAMARPPIRSRTTETAITLMPEAAIPCRKRKTSSMPKLVAAMQAKPARM